MNIDLDAGKAIISVRPPQPESGEPAAPDTGPA
jgi:hypothetical protein